MGYSANSHIESIKDVETFFHHLIDERKVNFHPDDDFADYVCYADNTSSLGRPFEGCSSAFNFNFIVDNIFQKGFIVLNK